MVLKFHCTIESSPPRVGWITAYLESIAISLEKRQQSYVLVITKIWLASVVSLYAKPHPLHWSVFSIDNILHPPIHGNSRHCTITSHKLLTLATFPGVGESIFYATQICKLDHLIAMQEHILYTCGHTPWHKPTIVRRCKVLDRRRNTLVEEAFSGQQRLTNPVFKLHQQRVPAHLVAKRFKQHGTILRQVLLHSRHYLISFLWSSSLAS